MDENSITTVEEDKSSVVNLNFLKEAFKAFAGSLKTVISGIEEDVTEYNNQIETNKNNITTLQVSIKEHAAAISDNAGDISYNAGNIQQNKSSIDEHAQAISENMTNITTINNTINPLVRPCISFVLPTDSNDKQWTQISDSLGYSCTYSSTNINIDCDYVSDLNFLPTDTIDYKNRIEAEWAKITHMEVGEQSVIFYASELPEGDIPIKIKQLF